MPSYLLYVVALGKKYFNMPIILARFLALMICGDFPSRFCMYAKVVHDEDKFVPATAALWDLDHLREDCDQSTGQRTVEILAAASLPCNRSTVTTRRRTSPATAAG